MKKFEVLSPAGDMESFKVAVLSGADAVYFGLNKFNARMKADNISLDNLKEVVDYAHLRNVRVYVTVNTLIASSEMRELVEMVGKCLECGVDAFIVQDIGVISVLKSVYPNIILHGSTQLGVHNLRGARVAKSMGLSRVVLSREVTLTDIKDIKENVDIELEVFVQGAMCVGFSGNCYFSSLKHNASGNRGLCKQLCRLPYELSIGSRKTSGYMISPRDNCMLDYLHELCEIGVVSFKIEGRLRRAGYVGVATRIYREAIDNILANKVIDIEAKKKSLAKVFSRGEFVSGYFDGNNVIDTKNNNHMGEKIGVVNKCEKFKDIYKIAVKTNKELHNGDGLKFVEGKNIITLGVGNVEKVGNNTIVYGKNYIHNGSIVYRVLDSEFESSFVNKTRLRVINMTAYLRVNEPIKLCVECDGFTVEKQGSIVQEAKSKPLEKSNVIAQVSKFGDDAFVVGVVDVDMQGDLFLSVAEINSIRREVISELKEKILSSYKLPFVKNDMPKIQTSLESLSYNSLAIVDEKVDKTQMVEVYDGLILSPTIYSLSVIQKFHQEYLKYFKRPLIINLPIIAMSDDLKMLDNIVEYASNHNIILLANNIYALDYISKGAIVWAGANMNIVSEYTVSALKNMGVGECVSSIEKWCGGQAGTYKMCKGRRVLMTMAHCPCKTLNNNECSSCSYCGTMKLTSGTNEYLLRRYRICKCYYELVDSVYEERTANNSIDDLRR